MCLCQEVVAYPGPEAEGSPRPGTAAEQILTPQIRMRGPDGTELSLFAAVMTFGTAAEVTTSELSIELTFPADEATSEALRALPRR